MSRPSDSDMFHTRNSIIVDFMVRELFDCVGRRFFVKLPGVLLGIWLVLLITIQCLLEVNTN